MAERERYTGEQDGSFFGFSRFRQESISAQHHWDPYSPYQATGPKNITKT